MQGSVQPDSSASVELFKADLLIPRPGLQVTFTYRPLSPPTPTELQLWCWMEPSNATQTRGGIEDDAAAGVDATKRARAAGSVKLLAMLQPDGLALVSSSTSDNSQAQLELERDVGKLEPHSNGWCSLQYNLPSHLPDFQHLTLRSIEVAAVTPAHLQHNTSAPDVCLGYVGHIEVLSQGSKVQAPRVSSVEFQDVIWTVPSFNNSRVPDSLPSDSTTESSAKGEADRQAELASSTTSQQSDVTESTDGASLPQVLWLYVTLRFALEQPSDVSRFEVFVRHGEASASDKESPEQSASAAQHGSKMGWVWLGTAATNQFRVTALECPLSDSAICFAVRPADLSGRLAQWQHAAYATLSRP